VRQITARKSVRKRLKNASGLYTTATRTAVHRTLNRRVVNSTIRCKPHRGRSSRLQCRRHKRSGRLVQEPMSKATPAALALCMVMVAAADHTAQRKRLESLTDVPLSHRGKYSSHLRTDKRRETNDATRAHLPEEGRASYRTVAEQFRAPPFTLDRRRARHKTQRSVATVAAMGATEHEHEMAPPQSNQNRPAPRSISRAAAEARPYDGGST
jgi:hypothetical protein